MRELFRKIRGARFDYEPLVKVQINQDNLLNNLNVCSRTADGVSIFPVLKSNAYGHGLVEVAKILEKTDVEKVVVDSFFEALILRNEGIKKPILVIGYSLIENILKNDLKDVTYTITDLQWLKTLAEDLIKKRKFNLKIDTGMHRQGIMMENIFEACDLVENNENIVLESICSHLADADNVDQVETKKQIDNWNVMVAIFKKRFAKLRHWHLTASEGLKLAGKINANSARLGLGLYGLKTDSRNTLDLKPVLSMKTIVTSIREVEQGERIGYGFTFETNMRRKIATIPVGYYEGVDRRLSNKGFVKVNGFFCPIVGRVSMNIVSVDVTHLDKVAIGDEVEVISCSNKDKNSIEKIAKICETIPYEILVHIPSSLRREII